MTNDAWQVVGFMTVVALKEPDREEGQIVKPASVHLILHGSMMTAMKKTSDNRFRKLYLNDFTVK